MDQYRASPQTAIRLQSGRLQTTATIPTLATIQPRQALAPEGLRYADEVNITLRFRVETKFIQPDFILQASLCGFPYNLKSQVTQQQPGAVIGPSYMSQSDAWVPGCVSALYRR